MTVDIILVTTNLPISAQNNIACYSFGVKLRHILLPELQRKEEELLSYRHEICPQSTCLCNERSSSKEDTDGSGKLSNCCHLKQLQVGRSVIKEMFRGFTVISSFLYLVCLFHQILIYNSVLKCQHSIPKSGVSTPRTVTKFAVETAIDLTSTI